MVNSHRAVSGLSDWNRAANKHADFRANKHADFRASVQEGDLGQMGDLCLCGATFGGQTDTPEYLELLLCESKWTQLVNCSLQAAFITSRRNWAVPQLSSSALFWKNLPHFWSSDWIYKISTGYRKSLRSLDQKEICTLEQRTVGTMFRWTLGRGYNRSK